MEEEIELLNTPSRFKTAQIEYCMRVKGPYDKVFERDVDGEKRTDFGGLFGWIYFLLKSLVFLLSD
jgi:hypothetical protein